MNLRNLFIAVVVFWALALTYRAAQVWVCWPGPNGCPAAAQDDGQEVHLPYPGEAPPRCPYRPNCGVIK